MHTIRKTLLGVFLLLAACGGGGGSPTPILGTVVDGVPQVHKSWVEVLAIDTQFDPVDVSYVVELDPTLPTDDSTHGIIIVNKILEYTNAMIVGYVPFYTIGDDTETTYVDFSAGIRWAADNGMEVVNLSWSGCCYEGANREPDAQYAFERGVTVVWGAGNDGIEMDTENSPYLLVIGANALYSNTGTPVDAYIGIGGGTSLSAARASGIIAELYEELEPTQDAAGAALIRDTFMTRYNNGEFI